MNTQPQTKAETLNQQIKKDGLKVTLNHAFNEPGFLQKAILNYQRNEDKKSLEYMLMRVAYTQIELDKIRLIFGETIEQELQIIETMKEGLSNENS